MNFEAGIYRANSPPNYLRVSDAPPALQKTHGWSQRDSRSSLLYSLGFKFSVIILPPPLSLSLSLCIGPSASQAPHAIPQIAERIFTLYPIFSIRPFSRFEDIWKNFVNNFDLMNNSYKSNFDIQFCSQYV